MNLGVGSWPARRAAVRPHDVAIEFEGRDTTYAEVADRVTRLAHALADAGVARQDRVAYMGFNHPALLETFFAANALTATPVLVNPRLKAAEVDFILRDAEPTVVLYGQEQAANVAKLRGALPGVRAWIGVDEGTEYEQFLAGGLLEPIDASVDVAEDVALIMYTSGTTGSPKGAMLTHQNLYYQWMNCLIAMDVRTDEVLLAVAPLWHIAGLNMVAVPTFTKGGRIIIHRGFDADAVLDEMERSRVTMTFMVPAMVDVLSQHPRWADTDFSSLRSLMVGGSPLTERTIRTWAGRGVPIMQGFGMTECSPGVTLLEARDSIPKAGSAGRPHFFTESRVIDLNGEDVALGETGEVVARGPNVMKGYWRNPDATARAIEDGWYHSGDVASYDEDGYLTIRDRLKDMYISGGENVYPAEIENALVNLGGVKDAAVIGVPDDRWGESGRAFVVLDPGVTETPEQLRTRLKEVLASYKLPRDIVLIDELPRTASGKVRKHDLRTVNV